MNGVLDLEEVSLSGRTVLLSLADLSEADDTPAHTAAVKRACATLLEDADVDVLGKPSEAEVNRALNELRDAGVVASASQDEPSPVGKGRPAYALDVDTAAVLDVLADDDQLAGAIDGLTTGGGD